jgi:tetratricopeptide (TPR) repeat protein
MHETGESRTIVGRRRADEVPPQPPSAPLLPPIPMRWIVRLAAVAIIGVAGTILWSKVSRGVRREQQQVAKKVDRAVDGAKDLYHSLKKATADAVQAARAVDAENDADAPVHDTPGAKLEAASRSSGPRPVSSARPVRVQTASRLLAAGKIDDAIQLLYQLRRQNPRSAEVALLLGHAYSRKLWRSDALREYGEALKLQPSLRNDRVLQRNSIGALDDPTFKAASAFIRARLGSAAAPELKRTSRQSKNPKLQARAARLAVELTDRPRSARR